MPEVAVALYRFLFAPVLLAVAVLTVTPRRAPVRTAAPDHPAPVTSHASIGPAPRAPAGAARAVASHPSAVR